MEKSQFSLQQDLLDEFDRHAENHDDLDFCETIENFKQRLECSELNRSFLRDLVELRVFHRLNSNGSHSYDAKADLAFLGPHAIEWAESQIGVYRGSGPQPELLQMEQITSKYVVEKEIKSGGMGSVFLAHEIATGRQLAIKTLRTVCPSLLYQLKLEFRSLSSLPEHPNIIRFEELFTQGCEAAITMEFITGDEFFDAYDNLRYNDAPICQAQRQLLLDMATGLHHLHCHNIVHRDVKSSNALVKNQNEVVILDFGLAQNYIAQGKTQTNAVVGTRQFMSPEQATGRRVGPESDWYSFGVLLFCCLTGCRSYRGDDILRIFRELQRDPSLASPLGVDFETPEIQLATHLVSNQQEDRPNYDHIRSVLSSTFPSSIHYPVTEALQSTQIKFGGRKTELRSAINFLSDSQHWPLVIDVVGPSGIGKTSYIKQLEAQFSQCCADRSDKPPTFVHGRCFYRENVPYPGLDQIVDNLSELVEGSTEHRKTLANPQFQPVFHLFPAIRRLCVAGSESFPGKGLEDTERQNRDEAVAAFIELVSRITKQDSLVWVIDDYQWANEETTSILRSLLSSESNPNLLLLIARRPDQSFSADTFGNVQSLKIELGRLTESECYEVLSTNLANIDSLSIDGKTKKETLTTLFEVSHGLPIYLIEFAAYLAENSEVIERDLDYQTLLKHKCATLTPEHVQLLTCVSATDQPLGSTMLEQVSGVQAAFIPILRELETRRLVTRSHDHSFIEIYHSKVSEALRLIIPKAQYTKARNSIVEYLRTHDPINYRLLGEQLAALGQMFEAATANANAAEEMQERLAYAEAEALFQAAIRLVNDCDVRTTSESLLSRCKLGLAQSWEKLGKCRQAGQLYSELASATTNSEDKLDLEQKASFLRMIDDQIRLPLPEIESLASSAGVRLFPWPTLYLVMTGLYRVIRGLINPRRQNDRQIAHRMQILALLTRGLMLTNPLMAAYFAARLAIVSKRQGDAETYENALDLEGLFCRSVRLPWHIDRLGTSEVDRHLAARHHNRDPLKRGFLHLSNAISAFANGRMLESLDENSHALNFYRQATNPPTWETEILAAFHVWAMHWHGDFNQLKNMLSSREEHLGVRPDDRNKKDNEESDLVRLPGYLNSAVSNALIRDDLTRAYQLMCIIDDLVSHPSTSGRIHELSFCRHYYLTYAQCFDEALANNQRQHQTTRQNGYKLIPIVVPGLYLYETAIRSSIALEKPVEISIQLRHMLRIRSKLQAHQELRFARGVQHSIDALLCYYSGRDAEFEQLVEIAIEDFEHDGFDSCSYFLRYQAAVKRHTERQKHWYHQAIKWAEERNILDLSKFSRITAPVFIRGVPKESEERSSWRSSEGRN